MSIWASRRAARYLPTSAWVTSVRHQEADHERGVEDLAEPEGLRDVQRDPEQGGRRYMAVQQRVEPFVGRPLESEGDRLGREHGL
jgi:hypothetical protein